MMQYIRRKIANHLLNHKGWDTDRKIIVFESDDWGSIRMPSKKVYNSLVKKNIPLHKSIYNKYDALESEEDLVKIFNLLKKHRDFKNNHPVITTNVVVGNPVFEKIKNSKFEEYHFEAFTDTYKRYPNHEKCLALWKEGIENKLVYPQFHGREHLNVNLWLELLRKKNAYFSEAFDNEFWGLDFSILPNMKKNIQATYDLNCIDELDFQKNSIKQGLNIFEKTFGYKSESFIANNFIWHSSLDRTLFEHEVKFIQGMKYQKLPLMNGNHRRMKRHYVGEKNEYGQTYLIRNCVFEPTIKQNGKMSINRCIENIKNAFFWKRPAIISSHRLNYIGFIDQDNRENNLKLLNKLFKEILKNWPEIEFLTSVQLGEYIEESRKRA